MRKLIENSEEDTRTNNKKDVFRINTFFFLSRYQFLYKIYIFFALFSRCFNPPAMMYILCRKFYFLRLFVVLFSFGFFFYFSFFLCCCCCLSFCVYSFDSIQRQCYVRYTMWEVVSSIIPCIKTFSQQTFSFGLFLSFAFEQNSSLLCCCCCFVRWKGIFFPFFSSLCSVRVHYVTYTHTHMSMLVPRKIQSSRLSELHTHCVSV